MSWERNKRKIQKDKCTCNVNSRRRGEWAEAVFEDCPCGWKTPILRFRKSWEWRTFLLSIRSSVNCRAAKKDFTAARGKDSCPDGATASRQNRGQDSNVFVFLRSKPSSAQSRARRDCLPATTAKKKGKRKGKKPWIKTLPEQRESSPADPPLILTDLPHTKESSPIRKTWDAEGITGKENRKWGTTSKQNKWYGIKVSHEATNQTV